MKHWVSIAALNLALAMALGAFGTHSLRDRLSEKALRQFQTGSQYHFFLGITLLIVAFAIQNGTIPRSSSWLATGLLAGCIVFSGSLYCLSITGVGWWGAITPIGGVIAIGSLVVFALKNGKST